MSRVSILIFEAIQDEALQSLSLMQVEPESQLPLPVQSRPPHCCQTGMALTVAAKIAAEAMNCFMIVSLQMLSKCWS